MELIPKIIEEYASRHSQSEDPLLQQISRETYASVESPQMLSGHLSGSFLAMIASIQQAKFILEIGTYVGYSALCLAKALPDDGQLITCDNDQEFFAIAKKNFAKSSLGHKISQRFGPALETIKDIEKPVDLVFIDADKENYPNYYELVLPKLRRGGLILIDNCLWSGRVLNPSNEEDLAIDRLNEILHRDERVENTIATIRDGIHIVRKK